MSAVVLRSPAKVNLWLKITGLREDGYHLLDSLFAPISLFDEIQLFESAKDEVEVFWTSSVPEDRHVEIPRENNLAYKAAQAFRNLKATPNLSIVIKKSIPSGGGLGGASSNAATTLRALQSLYGCTDDELGQIAVSLGADVKFFLNPVPSWVTGIGDKIKPYPNLPVLSLLLWAPPFSVLTKDAYSWFDARNSLSSKGLTHPLPNASALNASGSGLHNTWSLDLVQNDLEIPVIEHCPEILNMKKELQNAGCQKEVMTGSGSTMVGIFRNADQALAAKLNLQSKYSGSHSFFVCNTTTENSTR